MDRLMMGLVLRQVAAKDDRGQSVVLIVAGSPARRGLI